jgi:hypothetical protein
VTHQLHVAHPGCSDEALGLLAAKMGKALPSDYIDFLRSSNGGEPSTLNCLFKYRTFAKRNKHSAMTVSRWLSVDFSNGILTTIDNMAGMLPSGYIPIAELASGDALLMSLKSGTHGWIYIMEPDYVDDGNDPVTVLAKSFSDFLPALRDLQELDTIMTVTPSCNESYFPNPAES